MKYLLICYDKEKFWYELDEEGYASRQMILDEEGKMHISCLEDCLAEGFVDEADLEGSIVRLSQQEFDLLWQESLKKYRKPWERVQKKYPVGSTVQGICSYCYPQGTIIRGSDFMAIYKGGEPFCLHQSVQYQVKSYDDVNMWLVVG